MKLIIYGAGKEGIRAYCDIGSKNVYCFVDQNKAGESIDGIHIYRLEDLDIDDKNETFFFITPKKYKHEISEKLVENGYYRFCLYSHVISTDNNRALDASQWGKIYNNNLLKNVVSEINYDRRSSWSEELIKITNQGDKILEIGCGSGVTTLHLAKNGRICTAIDYSKSSIDLLNSAIEQLKLNVEVKLLDARKKLPFDDNSFDYVFQAGLLEHFTREERIELLKLWNCVGKTMISLNPNANSVAYRAGKYLQEKSGDWEYGMELPQPTMVGEFIEAGFHNVHEYSIGVEDSFNFLPRDHYLRAALERWYNEHSEDNFGQGYLICTIGDK